MRIRSIIFFLILFSSLSILAQEKKSLHIKKTNIAPKIDGVLDDDAWINADEAKDFIQFRPAMGLAEKDYQKTIVKLTYDDNAIYIAAYLHDKPEEIMRQFTSRDNFGQSDFFGVIFNPNNDAQNDTEFFVFSSGTQADAVASPGNGEDFGWNAVWDSAVKTVDDGWIVEMKIPYAALRFTNQEDPVWGLQFHRHFRTTREQFTWNPLDVTKGNIGLYHGELKGLKNLNPPTRLSLYPFASALVKTFDGETEEEFNFGLDVKYGLTENFTLDATLIPDFSQAGFDNVQLNLSPFEQQFSEQRQFFTEGVDLFNKGNLFYSRRIGSAPTGSVELTENEVITNYPDKVKMLNAVKVSGRTKKGLGIGFFNAITEKTDATIKKTEEVLNPDTNELETEVSYRHEVVEPFANYNILVIDKQFNKNSSVSLINTNVTRNGHFRDANVTGLLFDLINKENTYGVFGQAKMSSLNLADGTQNGFSSRIRIGKIGGKYRYSIGHSLADRKYDINDLGIQFRNNYNNFSANASYRIFEPTGKLNNLRVFVWANYRRLFKPSTYAGANAGVNVFAQTKKQLAIGGNVNYQIGKQYDFFEPRDLENNRFFIYENRLNGNMWFSIDYNKTFALDGNIGGATLIEDGRNYFSFWFGISPRFKLNEKFIFSYSFDYDTELKDRGFVNTINDDIIFGQRNRETIVNSISGNYNFNSFHGLTLTFRNYWSTATYYDQLYALQDNGRLTTDDGYTVDDIYDPNVNFNTWNLDFSYSWQFAPGSLITALYRNQLFNFDTASKDGYFDSINTLFDQPIEHTLSLRLVYFIDYNNVKNIFR